MISKAYNINFDDKQNKWVISDLTFEEIVETAWKEECAGSMRYENSGEYLKAVSQQASLFFEAVLFFERVNDCHIVHNILDAQDKMQELNNQHKKDLEDEWDMIWAANADKRKETAYFNKINNARYYHSNDSYPLTYESIRGI